MTTTSTEYTVDGLLQAIEELPGSWSLAREEHPVREWIFARARELSGTKPVNQAIAPSAPLQELRVLVEEWRANSVEIGLGKIMRMCANQLETALNAIEQRGAIEPQERGT